MSSGWESAMEEKEVGAATKHTLNNDNGNAPHDNNKAEFKDPPTAVESVNSPSNVNSTDDENDNDRSSKDHADTDNDKSSKAHDDDDKGESSNDDDNAISRAGGESPDEDNNEKSYASWEGDDDNGPVSGGSDDVSIGGGDEVDKVAETHLGM